MLLLKNINVKKRRQRKQNQKLQREGLLAMFCVWLESMKTVDSTGAKTCCKISVRS